LFVLVVVGLASVLKKSFKPEEGGKVPFEILVPTYRPT